MTSFRSARRCRAAASGAVFIAVSGCAAGTAPIMPTTALISATHAELADLKMSPADYASLGITLASRDCNTWFANLVEQSRTAQFGSSELSILGSAASMAGGPAGAAAGAVLSLLSSSIGNYQAATGLTTIPPAAIRGLVKRTQDAWLAVMPAPLSEADAFALVESYAELCQPPAVLQAIQQAMMTTPVAASTPAPQLVADGGGAFQRAAPRHRVAIPQVHIGSMPQGPPQERLADAVHARLQAQSAAIRKNGPADAEHRPSPPPKPDTPPPSPAASAAAIDPGGAQAPLPPLADPPKRRKL